LAAAVVKRPPAQEKSKPIASRNIRSGSGYQTQASQKIEAETESDWPDVKQRSAVSMKNAEAFRHRRRVSCPTVTFSRYRTAGI
jgi:hypothetical protein